MRKVNKLVLARPMCAHGLLPTIAAAIAVLALTGGWAYGHGIAGNRYFPGTATFDDPAIADELILPSYTSFKHPVPEGGSAVDNSFAGSFTRLLTPTIAVGADSNYTLRDRRGFGQQSGSGPTHLNVKGLLFEDDPHETLISASLSWGVGGLGDKSVGATSFSTFTPGLFAGRGFGDLPDELSWLRPFGIAGALAVTLPTSSTSSAVGTDIAPGRPSRLLLHNTNSVQWAFALEYSTLYLTDRFTGGPPKEEPLNQWVPLVEFSFDTPIGRGYGQKTIGTVGPGISYVAETFQLSTEAILPINRQSGSSAGVLFQALFFLDDLVPALFEHPIFGR